MAEYTPDEEHMEVAWIEYDDAATDINEAAAQFDRFLARVRRDAAREALDGLARDQEQKANRIFTRGGEPARRNRRMVVADEARRYRDTHYPKEKR